MSAAVSEVVSKRTDVRWIAFATAVVAIVFLFTVFLVKPGMPDRITLLAGPAGSADHTLALRYAEDLRGRGLDTDVVVTAGELDNWSRVRDDPAAVTFLSSALTTESRPGVDKQGLVTLGCIGFSPLWLFRRADLDVARIADLAGTTVATEGAETASNHVARKLIEANGLAGDVDFVPIEGASSRTLIERFTDGTLDAVFVVGAAESDLVRGLLRHDVARFVSFDRADAYAAHLPGVIALAAPEGVFDFARNVPPRDAQLLAATDCLVARDGLHRAIAPMLLVTAENVQRSTIFSASTAFPSRDQLTLPLDPRARRYFDRGETGLSKVLPYKAARWANHLGLVVMPLVAAVVLLLKVVPAGLRIWSGLKLKRMFKQLEAVEKGNAGGRDRAELLGDLDKLDRASVAMFVPMSTVHDYVDFRQFLHDMRERVEGERPG